MSKKARILIIEDDQPTRELFEEILKEAGYIVITANNGTEGLTLLETNQYELVLLDIMMPEIDGLEVLKKHQSQSNLKQSIVVMTNMANTSIIEEAKLYGAKEVIIKSNLDPAKFLEFVAKQL